MYTYHKIFAIKINLFLVHKRTLIKLSQSTTVSKTNPCYVCAVAASQLCQLPNSTLLSTLLSYSPGHSASSFGMTAEHLKLLKHVRCTVTDAVLWSSESWLLTWWTRNFDYSLWVFVQWHRHFYSPKNPYFGDGIFQTLLYSCILSWKFFGGTL